MSHPEDMEALLAQMSDGEKATVYRARDSLNLKKNDALWSLFVVLGHFETLYGRFPKLIADAAREATATARDAALAEVQVTTAHAKRGLVEAMAAAGEAAAARAAGQHNYKWTAICSVVVAAVVAASGWGMFKRGERAGRDEAVATSRREQEAIAAAAAWSNTPEGRLAYGLAQVGSVRELAECSGRGWTSKDGVCFVQPEKGKTYGWRIPRGQGKGR